MKEMKRIIKDFSNIIYDMVELESIQLDSLKTCKSILIIRSAPIKIFNNLINKLRSINPDIYLYIISHEHDRTDINEICRNNYELISYIGNGNYDISNFQEQLEYIHSQDIEQVLIMFYSRYGIGYHNIEEFISYIKYKDIYAYNCFNELFHINNIKLHMESIKTLYAISSWFYELIGEDQYRDYIYR